MDKSSKLVWAVIFLFLLGLHIFFRYIIPYLNTVYSGHHFGG